MDILEFFISSHDVWYQTVDGIFPLKVGSPIIPIIIDRLEEFYPRAYEALRSCYAKSKANVPYFNFLIVRRFCKCNFGSLDHTRNDLCGSFFNVERVSCPLLGECPYENVICMPKADAHLSGAEMRVMGLVCEGKSNKDIANELCLSQNTVKRHVSSAYAKTRSRSRADFMRFAIDNDIF